MNWLAHTFLSELQIDFQMGNILADPLKGRTWDSASDDMKKGMYVHKIIDSYTDSHKTVSKSKNRLRKKGLLKPIIIDLTYDYLLSKNWDKFSSTSLDRFTNDFYKKANLSLEHLPNKANIVIDNLIKKDLLNKYNNLELLEHSFQRMDKRLSQRLLNRESASGYFPAVFKHINYLEEDFLEFFPQLCELVKKRTIIKGNIALEDLRIFISFN